MCLSLVLLTGTAWAAGCTSAASACTEWVTVANGPARALVYRNHPLDEVNEGISRALVTIHGQGRDADKYFRHALAAAFLAGALENALIISVRFASNAGGRCRDTLAPDELNWVCFGPGSWRNGAPAVGNPQITSYDVVDEVLRRLARNDIFPNLKVIAVAGHSAGGQFVARYGMVNQIHGHLGVPITYVVANPSSYTYLDSLRPTASAIPSTVAAAAPGYLAPRRAKPPAAFALPADAGDCTAYDNWPYGLQNRTGYSTRLTDEQLKKQLSDRPAIYLVGELDILPLYGFDTSCSAMAQGPTRLARGLAFGKYVNENYGARHKTLVVAACGHSARCMFTAEPVLPLIFPKVN
ncbi:MAG: hypothetical protein HYU73_13470 [Betaproteobacteria bacterium]|nr:hypothetical protein [Betaproteobacteria bacterium]